VAESVEAELGNVVKKPCLILVVPAVCKVSEDVGGTATVCGGDERRRGRMARSRSGRCRVTGENKGFRRRQLRKRLSEVLADIEGIYGKDEGRLWRVW